MVRNSGSTLLGGSHSDFFACAYSWFVNDMAIVLFYAAMWEKDRSSFTDEFVRHFLEGYRRENDLDESWLREIPIC